MCRPYVPVWYSTKRKLDKSCVFFKCLSPYKVKWRYCHSHLRSSHSRYSCITGCRKFTAMKVRWILVAWLSYEFKWISISRFTICYGEHTHGHDNYVSPTSSQNRKRVDWKKHDIKWHFLFFSTSWYTKIRECNQKFRTGRLERELQMVQLFTTRCSESV